MKKKLKHHFLDAVIAGSIGLKTDNGVIVTTREFVEYFSTNGSKEYLSSYLPSVSIEAGRTVMQHNKYLFKVSFGIYKIHPDAISHHQLNHKPD